VAWRVGAYWPYSVWSVESDLNGEWFSVTSNKLQEMLWPWSLLGQPKQSFTMSSLVQKSDCLCHANTCILKSSAIWLVISILRSAPPHETRNVAKYTKPSSHVLGMRLHSGFTVTWWMIISRNADTPLVHWYQHYTASVSRTQTLIWLVTTVIQGGVSHRMWAIQVCCTCKF